MKIINFCLIIFALVINILQCVTPINNKYCKYESEKCPKDLKHIGCDNNKFNKCENSTLHILNETEINNILDVHNNYRNDVAAGNVHSLPKASKMKEIIWDDELASLAQKYSEICDNNFFCHSTSKHTITGQSTNNHTSKEEISMSDFVNFTMKQWFDQSEYFPHESINDFDPNSSQYIIGDFARMLNEDNEVGCAYITFSASEDQYHYLFICIYAKANVVHEKIYEEGDPCSKCYTYGKNYDCSYSNYTNLCKENKTYPKAEFNPIIFAIVVAVLLFILVIASVIGLYMKNRLPCQRISSNSEIVNETELKSLNE